MIWGIQTHGACSMTGLLVSRSAHKAVESYTNAVFHGRPESPGPLQPGVKFPRPTHHKDGYTLWYKRLEEGTFRFPHHDSEGMEVSSVDLALILEGIDLKGVKRHKRIDQLSPHP